MASGEGRKKIPPIGIEDFAKMQTWGYYYVDKTLFIKELLDTLAEVNVFLRPRRFGKTLALSTLKYFFEDTGDEARNAANRALFDGTKIKLEGEPYKARMTGHPVISLTLKSAKQPKLSAALITKSNRESGAGRPDIVLIPCDYNDAAIIIEIKLASKIDELGAACEDALRQIDERQYDADARAEGYTRFLHYGIAFYKKIAAVSCRRIDY